MYGSNSLTFVHRPLNSKWFLVYLVLKAVLSLDNQIIMTTIVVHSREDKGVGEIHEIKAKNQPQFSQTTMGQYWLDKTKAFRST